MTTSDIAAILSRLDAQDREQAEQRRDLKDIKATAERVERVTNGRVTELERESIARKAREEVVKADLDAKGLSRREFTAAVIGAFCIGIVTLIMHLANFA